MTTVFHPGNSEFLSIFFDYSRRGGGRVRNGPISDFFVMTDYEKPDPEKRSEIVEFTDLPEYAGAGDARDAGRGDAVLGDT